MGIYKKGNIYWFHKVWKKKKFEESLGTKNRKLADKRYYTEILPAILSGTYGKTAVSVSEPIETTQKPPEPTMREVIDKYMTEISPTHKGHKRNVEIATHWYAFFGDCCVSDVTKSKLATYKAKRLSGEIIHGKGKGRKAGESTVKKELSFLRQVFNKAIDEWDADENWHGYFRHNAVTPTKKVLKKMEDFERTRYVEPEEAKELAKFLSQSYLPQLKDMVVIGCSTGLREGKIVGLQVRHCDFANDAINIPAQDMKNKKPFSCKMTSEVKATLQRVIKQGIGGPYIFTDKNGQPFTGNAVSVAFNRVCKHAGIIDLRFHDLRHDFATALINNGASLYQVQLALGQKTPRMAARYAHLLPENRDVAKFLEGKGTATILRRSSKKKARKNQIKRLLATNP